MAKDEHFIPFNIVHMKMQKGYLDTMKGYECRLKCDERKNHFQIKTYALEKF